MLQSDLARRSRACSLRKFALNGINETKGVMGCIGSP